MSHVGLILPGTHIQHIASHTCQKAVEICWVLHTRRRRLRCRYCSGRRSRLLQLLLHPVELLQQRGVEALLALQVLQQACHVSAVQLSSSRGNRLVLPHVWSGWLASGSARHQRIG